MKKTIAIIYGGVSSEHEVSIRSAKTVIENLDEERYTPFPIYITKDGRWINKMPDAMGGAQAVISPDRAHGALLFSGDRVECVAIDAAIPVLHGKNGEDGTIQGLFTLAGIPFVGPSVISSAMCMDKAVANTLFDAAGIPHCRWEQLANDYTEQDINRIAERLKYPLFVKPACAGSSVGVSKARDIDEFREALALAFMHDRKAIVEECVVGQEIECAVFGNASPVASPIGEIIPPENAFYSYDEKYTTDTTGLRIPADLPRSVSDEVRRLAKRAYMALGCEGLSRCDFFYETATGKVLINEINTLPGFTSISMYPKLMEYSGMPIKQLVSGLIELAFERGEL